MNMRTIFAVASSAMLISGCAATTMPAGATEAELCRQWGGSLPTRSHGDTLATSAGIQRAYAVFAAACPAWADLVP